MSDTNVLGIDMSLNGTAIAWPNGYTDVCILNTNKSNSVKGPNRLATVIQWIDSHDFSGITHVCWENYAFSRTGQVFHIGELGGLVKLYFLSRGIPVIAVPPSTLKKYVTGKGNAKKEQMQETILDRWGYWYEDDNEADAFGLSMYGAMWTDTVSLDNNSVEIDELLDKVEYYGISELLQTFAITC